MRWLLVMVFALGLVAGCGDDGGDEEPSPYTYRMDPSGYPEECRAGLTYAIDRTEWSPDLSNGTDSVQLGLETFRPCGTSESLCEERSFESYYAIYNEEPAGVDVKINDDLGIGDAVFRLLRNGEVIDQAEVDLADYDEYETAILLGEELNPRLSTGTFALEIEGEGVIELTAIAYKWEFYIRDSCLTAN